MSDLSCVLGVVDTGEQLNKKRKDSGMMYVVKEVYKKVCTEEETIANSIWVTPMTVVTLMEKLELAGALPRGGDVKIAWIGCGDGKECVSVVALARENGCNVSADAFDVEEGCIAMATRRVQRHVVQQHVRLMCADVMEIETGIHTQAYDIVWSTAPVNPEFCMKWASFALSKCNVPSRVCYMAGFLGDHWPRAFLSTVAEEDQFKIPAVLAQSKGKTRTIVLVRMDAAKLNMLMRLITAG